jgi:hypothetical protein
VASHVAEALIMLQPATPHLNEHAWLRDRPRFERVVDASLGYMAGDQLAIVDKLAKSAASEGGDRHRVDELVQHLAPLLGGMDLRESIREVDQNVYTRFSPGAGSVGGAFADQPRGEDFAGRRMTIVIPFRASTDERTRNLIACLRAVRESTARAEDIEITVVEQDVVTRLSDVPRCLYDTHVLAVNAGAFNKAWAVNIGVARSAHEHVCVLDADLLADGRTLSFIGKALDEVDLVIPHRRVVWMDETSTVRTIAAFARPRSVPEEFLFDGRLARGFAISGSVGACIGVRKSFYMEIGGHDERFAGWGDEDNAFYRHATGRGAVAHGDLTMAHMHHPRAASVRADGSRLNEQVMQGPRPLGTTFGRLRKYSAASVPGRVQ